MLRRLVWFAVALVLWVWSATVVPYAIGVFDASSFARQVSQVSTLACVVAAALLVPLALRWRGTEPSWARVSASAIRIVASAGLLIDAASVWLHLRLDHGPGGDYPGWDLGPVAFAWHHQYFLHNAIVAVLALWLVVRRTGWRPTSQQGPTGPVAKGHSLVERLGRAVELGGVVASVGFLLVGLTLEWAGDAVWPPAPWRIAVAESEPLAEEASTSTACSLSDGSLLVPGGWAGWVEGEATSASCRYLVHRRGVPGEVKCLLEFPIASMSGLATENFASKLARFYYRDIRGLDGIRLYASGTAGRAFLILDARWCRWDAFVLGIRGMG